MAGKIVVLRMITDNSRSIGAIFGYVAVVPRNTIFIWFVIVANTFLIIIRYYIGSSLAVIIVIGRMMVEIVILVMTIYVKG